MALSHWFPCPVAAFQCRSADSFAAAPARPRRPRILPACSEGESCRLRFGDGQVGPERVRLVRHGQEGAWHGEYRNRGLQRTGRDPDPGQDDRRAGEPAAAGEIGRYTFQPGWRWSECIKPVVGTDSCQVEHIGYCVSGSLHVTHDDGSEGTTSAGRGLPDRARARRLERRRRADGVRRVPGAANYAKPAADARRMREGVSGAPDSGPSRPQGTGLVCCNRPTSVTRGAVTRGAPAAHWKSTTAAHSEPARAPP